jgi:hypothetical protein
MPKSSLNIAQAEGTRAGLPMQWATLHGLGESASTGSNPASPTSFNVNLYGFVL